MARNELSDRECVALSQQGDHGAFGTLVRRYQDRVYRFILRMVGSRDEAFELTQEAFIKAYQALPSFRGQSAFYTWLYRITMNVAADRARSRAAQGRAFGTERVPEEDWERVITNPGPGGEASPVDAAARREERQKIMKALDQLSEVQALQKRYTPFAYVPGTRFHASFGHLVGYSAMYYTYQWSLVIAKDLLTPFERTGLMAKDVTRAYRDKVLVPGGSRDAAELVRDFLGREYDFAAYERFLVA